MNVLKYLLTKKSVALLPHVNPDWDTYGSCLALRKILRNNGIKTDIIVDEPLSFDLSFLDTDVLIYDENNTYDYELVCAVDGSDPSRFSARAALFGQIEDSACIDHHVSDGFTGCCCIKSDAAATAEIIYDFLVDAGIEVDQGIAAYLYCGLSSDTGSFCYSNTTPHTLEVFRALLCTGIDIGFLSGMLYDRDTLPQFKLRAAAMQTIELYENEKIGICSITSEMINNCGATREDAGALSALPRSIHTVILSAVLKEEANGTVKVSFRGGNNVNVLEVAALFGGGGHLKAAGATIYGSVEEVKAIILPHLIKAVQ